jgi:Protein of unknown function (DUF2815)
MTEAKKPNLRKWVSCPARMSFPALLKPREQEDDAGNKTLKHQLTLLVPPGSDLTGAKMALKQAMIEKFGNDPKTWPKLKRGVNEVLADFAEYNGGRDKPLPGDWAGWTMIRCGSTADRPPGVVGPTKGADGKFPVIRDAREVYGGRWAKASLEAYFYDRKTGKGLTFGLINVQLLKHDAPFGNAPANPHDEFESASDEWAGGGDAPWGDEAAESGTANEGNGW